MAKNVAATGILLGRRRDFSSRANLDYLGLIILRYGVASASTMCQQVKKNDHGAMYFPKIEIQPYGLADLCRVRAPEGGFLEFLSVAD